MKKFRHPIGRVSGNERLDPSTLEERDVDNDNVKEMWLTEALADPDFENDMKNMILDWKKIMASQVDIEQCTFFFIAKSHLDIAYKWRFEQTIKKGIKTLQKAVMHSEMYPDVFHFTMSSPLVFQWIKDFNPILYDEIKQKVKLGNIELIGGAWIEPDSMMPSGESYVRHRLYGMRFFQEEFGILPEYEYLPDCFGFNVGLPQILRKSGAKGFMTHKMTWNQQNDFPILHAKWESPDGSQILAILNPGSAKLTDDGDRFLPFRYGLKPGGKKVWSYSDELLNYKNDLDMTKPIKEFGLFRGKGDGGHGPTHQEVAELLGLLNAAKKMGLNFKWATAKEYFDTVGQYDADLPIWKDELYLEDHRGTFSVHPFVKRINRKFETLIQSIETFTVLNSILSNEKSYPYDLIESLWKTLLILQFHDVLPGSSIPEVFDDVLDYADEMKDNIAKITDPFFKSDMKNTPNCTRKPVTLFNPLSWNRNERIFIPITIFNNDIQLDIDGKPPNAIFSYQISGEEKMICLQPIAAEPQDTCNNNPAGWWGQISILALNWLNGSVILESDAEFTKKSHGIGKKAQLTVKIGPTPEITNGITTVKLDPATGAITELCSKEVNKGINLVKGDQNNLTLGYEDDNPRYPAWNLKLEYWKYPKNYNQSDEVKFSIKNVGSVFVSMLITRKLGISRLEQEIRLFADDPTVYCLWSSDWQEPLVTLKLGIAPTTNAEYTTSDQMYCALKRRINSQTTHDKNRYEQIMHNYVDCSTNDHNWGIAIINEGKYAYDTLGGMLKMTMHRSPTYPDPAAEAWAIEERLLRKAKDGTVVPRYTGIGSTSCRYAYFPHQGGALTSAEGKPNALVKRKAEAYNFPILVFSGNLNKEIVWNLELPENIQLAVLKRTEWPQDNHIILRFVEIAGGIVENFSVKFPTLIQEKIINIEAVDLLERKIPDSKGWHFESRELKLSMHPFEIATFKIYISE
jgi:alpha-mannosidase